jgi:hypothetical protein
VVDVQHRRHAIESEAVEPGSHAHSPESVQCQLRMN